MKDYKVLIPISLFAGQIRLTEEQSKPRMHCLKKSGKNGIFDVTQEVSFKAGEIIGLERVSKAHASNVAAVEKAEK